MSPYNILKTTKLYITNPSVRRRVNLRITRDQTFDSIKLFNLDIEVTTVCNLRCKTCYNPFLQQVEISFEQFCYIIRKGKDLAKSLNLDGLWLTISGGEPFSNPNLVAMLEYARQEGIVGIAIITNGTLLTHKKIGAIKRLHIDEIMVSIDGGDRMTHDQNRGSGAFNKMLKGVSRLHNESPETFTGSTLTLTSKNLGQIKDYAKLAYRLGFCYAWVNPPVECGRIIDSDLTITREQSLIASKTVRDIDTAAMKYGFNIYYNLPYYALSDPISPYADFQTACPFARNNLTICANGNVLPCLYSRDYILGNIYKQDLRSLYDLPMLRRFRSGDGMPVMCQSCKLAAFCGGCRARTYYRTGDWFAPDSWCPLYDGDDLQSTNLKTQQTRDNITEERMEQYYENSR